MNSKDKIYVLLHSYGYEDEHDSVIEAVGSKAVIKKRFEEAKQKGLEDYQEQIESGDYEVTETEDTFAVENTTYCPTDYFRYTIVECDYEY